LKHEHGTLARVFRSLATADRPADRHVDAGLAHADAQAIYDAGEGHWGTDEGEFVRVLVSHSYAQLRATFDEYEKLSGKNLEDAIRKELNGNLQEALLAIGELFRDYLKPLIT
jgi:hypothetical protein